MNQALDFVHDLEAMVSDFQDHQAMLDTHERADRIVEMLQCIEKIVDVISTSDDGPSHRDA